VQQEPAQSLVFHQELQLLVLPTAAETGPSEDDNSSSTSGLSAGAKAGIGVGAAIGTLALIAVTFVRASKLEEARSC